MVHVVVELAHLLPRWAPTLERLRYHCHSREPVNQATLDGSREFRGDPQKISEILAGRFDSDAESDTLDNTAGIPVVMGIPLIWMMEILGQHLRTLQLLPLSVLVQSRSAE